MFADYLGIYGNTVVDRPRPRRLLAVRPPELASACKPGQQVQAGEIDRADRRDRPGRRRPPALLDHAARRARRSGRVVGSAVDARARRRPAGQLAGRAAAAATASAPQPAPRPPARRRPVAAWASPALTQRQRRRRAAARRVEAPPARDGRASCGAVLLRDAAADVAIAHRLGAIAERRERRAAAAAGARHRRQAASARKRSAPCTACSSAASTCRERRPKPRAAQPPPSSAIEGLRVAGRRTRRSARLVGQAAARRRRPPVRGDQRSRGPARSGAQHGDAQGAQVAARASWKQSTSCGSSTVDWRYADFLMHRAFEWARARGTRMAGDYPALRAQLTAPAAGGIDAADRAGARRCGGAGRRRDAARPVAEPARRAGAAHVVSAPTEQLKPYLDELGSVQDSPLVLNRVQQQERFEAIIVRAIDTMFGGEQRAVVGAPSLRDGATTSPSTRRPERADAGGRRGAALEGERAPHDIPFCAHLVRASLAFFFQLRRSSRRRSARRRRSCSRRSRHAAPATRPSGITAKAATVAVSVATVPPATRFATAVDPRPADSSIDNPSWRSLRRSRRGARGPRGRRA